MARVTHVKLSGKMLACLISGILFTLGLCTIVYAYSGTMMGVTEYHGYFTGYNEDWGDSVLPAIYPNSSDGILNAIPDYVDTVGTITTNNSLMKLLYDANTSGDNQRVVGSAFVVNTMLGRNAPGSGKNVSSADWADLTARLQGRQDKGRILWHGDVNNSSNDVNSFYQDPKGTSNYDDAFYTKYKNGPGIQILNDDGSIAYTILRACANPIGKLSEVPKLSTKWFMEVTASVNVTTARPNDTITWTHNVTNNGLDPTDKVVTYYWQYTTGSDTTHHDERTSNPPLAPSTTSTALEWNSSYTVRNTDVGQTICRQTVATPYSSSDSSPTKSSLACVHILPLDTSFSTCRPISFTTGTPPTNVHTGQIVPIQVIAVNSTTGATIYEGSYTKSTTLDLSLNCTTGDTWTIKESTSSYVYYHYDYYWPCGSAEAPAVCGPQHIDLYTSYSRNTVVGPCYDYIIKTGMGDLSNYDVEATTTISVVPKINSYQAWTYVYNRTFADKYGDAIRTKSKPTNWQISEFTIAPNAGLPNANTYNIITNSPNSDSAPCDYYKSIDNHLNNCKIIANGSGSTVFDKNGVSDILKSYSVNVGDTPAGTKFCFAFSVQADSSDDGQWNNSALNPIKNCVIIVKKPKVQILGGDLITSGLVSTSTSDKSINGVNGQKLTYGSWDEYGIFAAKSISGMASGSAFVLGLPASGSTAAPCSYSSLSFANIPLNGTSCTGSAGSIGYYANSQSIPDVAANFSGAGSSIAPGATISPNNLPIVNGKYIGTGTALTLSASTLTAGKSIIIKADTVTIAGDQIYSNGPYTSVYQLPQLVIIANRIVIDGNVKNVDAWLIANNSSSSGSIYTCDVDGKTINDCPDQLTVNGFVVTDKLYLGRTAGSGVGANSGDPAEAFNLRADSYLWAAARASSDGHIQTVYTTELPPRF